MKKTGEILRVENLTRIYGEGENAVRALDGVSFSVHKGEFVAVIGASGSGKSTLLHLLGGVDRPTSGKVFVGGVDVYAQNEEASWMSRWGQRMAGKRVRATLRALLTASRLCWAISADTPMCIL